MKKSKIGWTLRWALLPIMTLGHVIGGNGAANPVVQKVQIADGISQFITPPAGMLRMEAREVSRNQYFLRDGKLIANVPGTLKTDDNQVTQDDVILEPANGATKSLREIDFGHQREALVFGQSGT